MCLLLLFGGMSRTAFAANNSQIEQKNVEKPAKKFTIGFHENKNGQTYYNEKTNGKRLRGMHKIHGKKYYFGQDSYLLKKQWIRLEGNTYRADPDGVLRTGFWETRSGKTYYFDKRGVMKFGWQRIDGHYYCFKLKKGEMYRSCKIDGVDMRANGSAKVNPKNKKYLDAYIAAQKLVEKITKPDMTKSQKLRSVANYVANMPYVVSRDADFRNYKGWEVDFANDILLGNGGVCFAYAGSFAFMAHAIGYEDVYVCARTGYNVYFAEHGWAQIGDEVYDPMFQGTYRSSMYCGKYREGQRGYSPMYKVKIGDL